MAPTRPKAISDELTFNEDGAISGNVLSNDIAGMNGKIVLRFFNGDNVLAKKSGQVTEIEGQYGTFHVKADGTFTYTLSDEVKGGLQDGETLNETVIYKISDSNGNTSQASLNLTVAGKTAPVAVNDEYSFQEGDEIAGNVLSNDIPSGNGQVLLRAFADQKFNGEPKTVDVEGQFGTFHVSSDGSFTYDLNGDLEAGVTVTETIRYYKVSDGAGNTDTAKLTLTITGTDATSGSQEPTSGEPDAVPMNSIQLTGLQPIEGLGSDHGFMS